MTTVRPRRFLVDDRIGAVSALVVRPRSARAMLVVAHGAGAGMTHPFLEGLCQTLARHRIATFRFQFPYTEVGRRAPDRAPVLTATITAALGDARRVAKTKLPLFAGGKSMGGRMTSLLLAERGELGVRGLVFIGFPLHAAGKPSSERGRHLSDVAVPMLFLQGTRDSLADLRRLRPVVGKLKRATLHVVEGGDHSFATLKRSGRTRADVLEELAGATADWIGLVS